MLGLLSAREWREGFGGGSYEREGWDRVRIPPKARYVFRVESVLGSLTARGGKHDWGGGIK